MLVARTGKDKFEPCSLTSSKCPYMWEFPWGLGSSPHFRKVITPSFLGSDFQSLSFNYESMREFEKVLL